MKVDPRFLKEEGWEVYTGSELLVKGLLETEGGTHLWTGYPGSPVAGFFDCIESIQALPKQYGIRAYMSNNEALAAAALNGAQMAGLKGMIVMKSVGVHVAADALALGNLAGTDPDGGALVVLGDDPWNESTQVPSDSRYLCKHLHMPVMEPSTPQETKDWVELGFKLSGGADLYMGYMLTTNQADGGGSVMTRRNHFPKINALNQMNLDTSKLNLEKSVLLPPRTSRREENFKERYKKLWELARNLKVNSITNDGKTAPIGFMATGLGYLYLMDALRQMGLEKTFPVLKMGVSYPLDPEMLRKMKKLTSTLVIIEERRGFMEEQAAHIVAQEELGMMLYGKKFPGGKKGIPDTRGLNSSVLVGLLYEWMEELWKAKVIDREPKKESYELIRRTGEKDFRLAARTPTFCPGCPHRDSASVLMEVKRDFMKAEYMRRRHRREPVDLIFHGDTGCYTMLMFEPTKDLMHNYSGMGLGGGTGMGVDAFVTNKQVVFMGDGTFFHSGQSAISNSVKNGQDITYIILDNKTTAMTGHQPTAGMGKDLLGCDTHVQDIQKIVQAVMEEEGVGVVRVNPEIRDQYREILEETILRDGVKVLIADKECGIEYHRRVKKKEATIKEKKGYLPKKKYINIATDACEYCLECTLATGCPGLTFLETDFGRKVTTDMSWCVADGACSKLDACPSFEKLTVVRTQKPENLLEKMNLDGLEIPKVPDFEKEWRVYLAGVGGMGVGITSAALVRAAHREGYRVNFCDKKGLAIRNGGVYSQLMFCREDDGNFAPLIPYGGVDLLLGLDPLEAARGLDGKGTQRVGCEKHMKAVINTYKTPTILGLLGKDDFCVDELEGFIRGCSVEGGYFSHNLSETSERFFGTKLYVNVMLLGVAFQAGLMPISLENLEWGMRETMRKGAKESLLAFHLGRRIYENHKGEVQAAKEESYHDIIAEKTEILNKMGEKGRELAKEYWKLTVDAIQRIRLEDEKSYRDLALRIYELIQYENLKLARRYVERLARVFAVDQKEKDFQATRAVLWNLFKVTAIKDEVYVAYLLTRPEKYQQDREKYRVNEAFGDRIVYEHLNRPEFVVLGVKVRFKIQTKDWMLKLVARAKILRKLMFGWHKKERIFRNWYVGLVENFVSRGGGEYEKYVELLRLPENVRGYREVRYPKMEEARRRAEDVLKQLKEEKGNKEICGKRA